MAEMGLGRAVDCRARNGYHVREADLCFEIIDLATSLPVLDGEPGGLKIAPAIIADPNWLSSGSIKRTIYGKWEKKTC